MKASTAVAIAVYFTSCIQLAYGWGTEGHEIVANIAYERLSPATQQFVSDVLGPVNGTREAGSPLAAVADWADRVRYYYHWSAPLHYIDVRDDLIPNGCPAGQHTDGCEFIYIRDCPNDVCVAGAIRNYTMQIRMFADQNVQRNDKLRGSRSSAAVSNLGKDHVQEALKFLTHFVGDIHQPLHCSRTSDKGGNDFHVKFDLKLQQNATVRDPRSLAHHSWNLHSVWDTGIIDKAIQEVYGTRQDMELDLIKLSYSSNYTHNIKKWLSCPDAANISCAIEWGQESFQNALDWAYENSDGTEVQDGSHLDDEYYSTRLHVVKERLIAGGVRLSAILEGLSSSSSSSIAS